MTNNKNLLGLLGLLFLLSVSQAQDALTLPEVPVVPLPDVTDGATITSLTASVQEASSQVNTCFYADTPGTVYTLTGDLTGTKGDGSCITISANDVTIDCNGHSITGYSSGNGIYSQNVQNITISDCTISSYTYGIYSYSTHNSNFINNVVYDNSGSFILQYSDNNALTNNVVHDSSSYGFYMDNCLNNNLVGNTAYNTYYAFLIMQSSDADITNNTVHDSQYGFYIYYGLNNYLTGNTAYDNGFGGFLVSSSPANTLYDNNAYNNARVGFYLVYSDSIDISLATAQGSQYGFYISGSNVNLASSASHSNHYSSGTSYGLYIIGPGTVDITDMHLYNQSAGSDSDFRVAGDPYSPTIVAVQNMIIDNPQGNFEDYTSINIYDSVDLGTIYTIKWSAEPATPPSSYQSFEQKYVDISGSTSIDGISWHWLDSELTGYDESKFALWKYGTSGWTNTGANLNANANYLSLSNMNPQSTYGILESVSGPPSDTCKVIDSPGSYQLTSDVVGAPFAIPGVGSPVSNACIVIDSSDVDFTCNGYGITNDGTTSAAGIVIGTTSDAYTTNVTVRDCISVSNYDIGVLLLRNSDSNKLIGNIVHNNQYGFYMYISDYNTLTDNTAHNNALSDFYLYFSLNNNLISNTAHDSNVAFNSVTTSIYKADNSYINNTIYNAVNGFYTSDYYSRFIGNTVLQTTNAGFWSSGSYNVFDDNFVVATGSTGLGINLGSGSYNNITNNRVQNATYGFYTSGTGNRFINNVAYDRSGSSYHSGFYAYGDTNSVFIDNEAYNVPTGFQTWGSTNIIVSNTQLYNNAAYGLLIRTPKDATISNVHLYNNGKDVYVDNYAAGATDTTLSMSNLIIDSPTGNYQDYTNIITDDYLTVNEWYIMTWSEPIPPPPTHSSFAQKYVDISPLHIPTSLSTIRWTWHDDEVTAGGYDESKFELWWYNGTEWSNVSGQILDTTNNYIELSDYTLERYYAPHKSIIYAILQNINTAPSVTIEAPADNTGTSSTDLNYTVNDVNTASCWYYLDGTEPIPLPGCTNTTLGPLGEGQHSLILVVTDTFGEQTSTTVDFLYDVTPPTLYSIQSPTNSTYYNAPVTISLEYTASDNFGLESCWYYLDGTGPIEIPDCTNTTLGPLEEGQHSVAVYVSDSAGNIDYEVVYFTVKTGPEGCATLEVEAMNHLVQCGTNPSSSKVPLVDISVCAYDKSPESCAANIGVSHHNYEAIWNNCEPINCAKTNELGIADILLPAGDYIILSVDATKTVLESPLGVSASDFQCAVGETTETTYPVTMYKHLQMITKCDGKKVPGKTSKVQGSELLIIEPEYVLWDSTEELFPILFESAENWGIEAYLETPEGYVPDYDVLEASTPDYAVVQFTVTEVGSIPDNVGVTLALTDPHGNSIIRRSQIGTRLSENLANAKGVAITKNGVIVGRGKAVGHKTAPLDDWGTVLLVMIVGVGVVAVAAFERSRKIEKKVSK